jgi:peptide/nickel transport system substrate-binding protein
MALLDKPTAEVMIRLERPNAGEFDETIGYAQAGEIVMFRLRGLVGIAVLPALLLSCSSGGGSATSHSGPLTARLFFAPAQLDPQACTEIGCRMLTAYAYDTPVAFRNGKIVPRLASTWDVSLTSIKLTIRPDVTCSDGSKLGAAEVADSVKRMIDPTTANTFVTASFGTNKGITATADTSANTVTIEVPNPYGDLLYGMTNVQVVCRAGLKDPSQLKTKTFGSGQYVLDEFVNGDHYTYSKRNGYKWGPDGLSNDGSQWPTKITFKVIADETTATNLFISGGLDLTVAQGPDIQRLNSNSRVTFKKSATVDIYTIYINHSAGRPTADVNIRRMLWAGLNRSDFGKAIAPGAQVAQTFVDPGGQCYSPDKVSSAMIPFNVTQAQQYAAQSGYQLQGGQLVKDGKQLAVTVLISDTFGNAVGDYLTAAWGKVGVKVNAITEPASQAVKTLVTPGGDWDMLLGGGGDYSPTILIKNFRNPGPPNFWHVNNASFNALADQARVTPTQSACDLWNSAEQELYKAADFLPFMLVQPTTYGHNLTFTPWLLTGVYPDTLHWT